jgi:hypothetical protein
MNAIEKMICDELKQAILDGHLFDVVGGTGIDISKGASNCMSNDGLWFRFCPFCGEKIIKQRTESGSWEWYEERQGGHQ